MKLILSLAAFSAVLLLAIVEIYYWWQLAGQGWQYGFLVVVIILIAMAWIIVAELFINWWSDME